MKFTSEDLMKAMGLSVGSKLLINNDIYIVDEVGTLHSDIKMGYYDGSYLSEIVDVEEFEILPRPKRVGDLKCEGLCHNVCPVRIICSMCDELGVGDTFYEYLETYKTVYSECCGFDQEIYDLLKARLDKEVE
jgi:hypothetical protein